MPDAPRFLGLTAVRDALVVPRASLLHRLRAPVVVSPRTSERVTDGAALHPLRRSLVARATRRVGRALRQRVPAGGCRQLDTAVFAGILHDPSVRLLRNVERLWMPPHDLPLVWIAGSAQVISPHLHEVLDLLGLGPERYVVTARSGGLGCRELWLPEPGCVAAGSVHPWLARRVACWDEPLDDRTLHVWVMGPRCRAHPDGGCDQQLMRALEAEGWVILRPDEMSVPEALSVVSRAAHVAGPAGGALDLLSFLRGPPVAVDELDLGAGDDGLSVLGDGHATPAALRAPTTRRRHWRAAAPGCERVPAEVIVQTLRASCARHGRSPGEGDG